MKVSGLQNVPSSGGFLLACNHIAYWDPPICGSWCGRYVFFLAKQELFDSWLLGRVLHATNARPIRRGAIDRRALDMCVRFIDEGNGLVIFPEGTRSMGKDFLSPKPGIGMLALRARCPIVPCYIHGTNDLRGCLKKASPMRIAYGESIKPEEFTDLEPGKESYAKIAAEVMRRIGFVRDLMLGSQ